MARWKLNKRRNTDQTAPRVAMQSDQVIATHATGNRQLHAEEGATAQMPGAIMTSVHGWRRNLETLDLEWVEIPVCLACQERFPRTQFEPGVSASPNGAWAR